MSRRDTSPDARPTDRSVPRGTAPGQGIGSRGVVALLVNAVATTTAGLAVVAASASPAASAPTCTITFNDTTGGSFFDTARWNDAITPTTHRVPTTTDVACIPAGVTGAVTFSTGSSATLRGLTASGSGGFTMGAGTLTLTDTANGSTITKPTLSGGTLTGDASLTLTGAGTWAGTTLSGTGPGSGSVTVKAAAAVTVNGSPILQRNLTNDGTITVGGFSYLNFNAPGATLTNNGTIDLHGDNADIRHYSAGPGTIVNTGTIVHGAGTGTATIAVPVISSLAGVQLQAGTGTLALEGGGTLTGTGSLPAGTTLDVGSTGVTMDGVTMNGAGLTILDDLSDGQVDTLVGTVTFNAPLALRGDVAGAGDLVVSTAAWTSGTVSGAGSMTVKAGSVATVDGYPVLQRNLTNNGTISVLSNYYPNFNNPAATLSNNGTIDLHGENADIRNYGAGPGAIVNSGVIKRSLGTGTATITAPIVNKAAGELRVETGVLGTSTITNLGTLDVGYQTLAVTGTLTSKPTGVLAVGASSTAHGTVTVNGTTVLGGQLAIALAPGYDPPLNTAIPFVTTTGTQTGRLAAGPYQLVTPTKGWKLLTAAKKVVAKLRPVAETAAGVVAPPSATQGTAFGVDASVTDNGPAPAGNASVRLVLPSGVALSGPLPAGCTQPTSTTVRCAAGTLAHGATATWTIPVTGTGGGVRVFTVSSTSANTDIVSANDKASASTTVS